jgi:hypothetical protein
MDMNRDETSRPTLELNEAGLPVDYVPTTELGRRLVAIRARYARNGGKFLNREEIDAEIKRRRGLDQ